MPQAPEERYESAQSMFSHYKSNILDSELSYDQKNIYFDGLCRHMVGVKIPASEQLYKLERELIVPLNSSMAIRRMKGTTRIMTDLSAEAPPRWIQSFAKDSIFLDIGANIGLYSALAICWGSKLSLAVEPVQVNCGGIQDIIDSNNMDTLKIINAACSPINQISKENDLNRKFMILETPANFPGVARSKLVEDSQARSSNMFKSTRSILVPKYSIHELIQLASEIHSLMYQSISMDEFLSKLVIKIDTDCVDSELLGDLLSSGIASKLKALMAEVFYSELLAEECISYGAKIISYSPCDVLICPVKN